MSPHHKGLTFTLVEELPVGLVDSSSKTYGGSAIKTHRDAATAAYDINLKYNMDKAQRCILGRGDNSVVRKVIERETGKQFAVKSIQKSYAEQYQAAKEEAYTLARLDHPNIIKNYESYEDRQHFYMITDICKGGEVFEKVEAMSTRNKYYPEHKAASIIQQLFQAVTYCHDNNIVHRDIKLENILLKSKNKDDTNIKLIDFGLSTKYDPTIDEPMTSKVGSPYYVAPEVLNGSYTNSCDVWSIGVTTYALLTATFPFESLNEICSEEEVEFPSEGWNGISDVAKDFIRSLLQKDPSLRPSAAEAANHEWFQVITDSTSNNRMESHKKKKNSFLKKIRKSLTMKVKGKIHPH